jgi:hypothetical protein
MHSTYVTFSVSLCYAGKTVFMGTEILNPKSSQNQMVLIESHINFIDNTQMDTVINAVLQ